MRSVGARNENETAPDGVMPRWQMSMDSCSAAACFLSGFILRTFSLMLQAFSYHPRWVGMNSSLNCWYSWEFIWEDFSTLTPSSLSRLRLYRSIRLRNLACSCRSGTAHLFLWNAMTATC